MYKPETDIGEPLLSLFQAAFDNYVPDYISKRNFPSNVKEFADSIGDDKKMLKNIVCK